ncbi:MAG: winged helix-turn-helix transcriptional regulator [Rhodomicrobium sp.]|nr:winged helix-turn-helix transcriptional regulator [Rhodomicrobium sp.]
MTKKTFTAAQIHQACICLGLRTAARAVSRRYDQAFRHLGLTSGQFSTLAALLRDKPVQLGQLAETLGMDRTTLNRNLNPLIAQGLVADSRDEKDQRIRALVLTGKGRALLDRALPAWEAAQAESAALLKETSWPQLREALGRLN